MEDVGVDQPIRDQQQVAEFAGLQHDAGLHHILQQQSFAVNEAQHMAAACEAQQALQIVQLHSAALGTVPSGGIQYVPQQQTRPPLQVINLILQIIHNCIK